MYESTLENRAREYIKKCGGKLYKWVSPGNSGVPDRIAVLPKGRVIFIEFKRPGLSDGLRARQKKVGAYLQKLGCTVWRISDFDDLKARLETYGI